MMHIVISLGSSPAHHNFAEAPAQPIIIITIFIIIIITIFIIIRSNFGSCQLPLQIRYLFNG